MKFAVCLGIWLHIIYYLLMQNQILGIRCWGMLYAISVMAIEALPFILAIKLDLRLMSLMCFNDLSHQILFFWFNSSKWEVLFH